LAWLPKNERISNKTDPKENETDAAVAAALVAWWWWCQWKMKSIEKETVHRHIESKMNENSSRNMAIYHPNSRKKKMPQHYIVTMAVMWMSTLPFLPL